MLNVMGIKPIANISFGRAIRTDEKTDFSATNRAAKEYLGIKNMALIMHGSSFPVGENDLFIGSPFSAKAAETNEFLRMFGFDSNQLGPQGLISKENYSPYNSSINSKNHLFADMSKLTKAPYSSILQDEDIKSKASNIYQKNSDMTDFERAFDSYDSLFEKAYENLTAKVEGGAKGLKNEFETFKKTSGDWLETDSLYEVLRKKFADDDYEKWADTAGDSDMAQKLISYKNDSAHPKHQQALNYLDKLNSENSKELDLFKFKQFIIDKQEREFIKENPNKLDYMSDAIIGFSPRDMWANQEAFLKDFRVGCPHGGQGHEDGMIPRGANQMWDIPVLNPNSLFNEDGSLGKGGVLLRQKFSNLLDTYQNIRIDHAFGLVDPWIYNKKNIETKANEAGEIVYNNANGAFLSKFGKPDAFPVFDWYDDYTKNIFREMNNKLASSSNLDPKGNYSQVLEKILLPLFAEKGLEPNSAVWEDLGEPSNLFKQVYYDKLRLPGIVDLKGNRGEGVSRKHFFLVSSHDNPPFSQVASNQYFENNRGWGMTPEYLAGFLHPEKTDDERKVIMHDLTWDTIHRVKTKYEELFRCGEKIQISFMDFFGLDKTYNKSGTSDKANWKLRLTSDYQKDYYQTLERKDWKKIALNVPELFKQAIISKIYTTKQTRAQQDAEFTKMKPLIDKLDRYEKILYAPEANVRKIVTSKLKEANLSRVLKKVSA